MKRNSIVNRSMRRALWSIATVSLMASCHHKDPDFVYEENDGKLNATVTVTDENGEYSPLAAGTELGVYMEDAQGNITFHEVEVDANGNIVLPSYSEDGGILLYAPYQGSWPQDEMTSSRTFAVQEDQTTQEGYNASDLIMGGMGNNTRAEAKLVMEHKLAKVTIHVVDETGAYDLTQSGLKLLWMNDAVNVSLLSQSVETIADSHADIAMMSYTATDHRMSLQAIVAPQTRPQGEEFLNFVFTGFSELFSLPNDAVMEGGKTFSASFRLTEVGIVYDGSTITDWEESGGDEMNTEY